MRSIHTLSILFLVFSPTLSTFNFLILHNNDMHGRFEETSRNTGTCKDLTPKNSSRKDGCVGGFARTAYIINEYREKAKRGESPILYLNAGDTYVGTAWFAVHKENITTEFLNALKPDVASLGNHEFDFGVKTLAPFVQKANFPIVGANMDFTNEPSLSKVQKSVVLEISGRKIGIVGHLTPDTQIMSSTEGVIFLDIIESVKNETENLEKKGVEIIIILGHSGYEMDKLIAEKVPLADIVVGGHTNTFLWNGPQPDLEKPEGAYPTVVTQPSGKKVPVVQAYAYTKYLGFLNVTFDNKGDLVDFKGQPIFLNTDVPQSEEVLQLLDKYRPSIDALDRQIVGQSPVLLDATSNKCRFVECNLGNMIADSFVFYMATKYKGKGWTDTPIGLINGGSVRTTIDPSIRNGSITRGELMGTLPFENQIVSVTLNGSEIIQTLEIGARSNGETSKGEFLQVSGLHVVYDYSKPSYQRVVEVEVRCGDCNVPKYEKLDENKFYNIITVSFLTAGGDGHYLLNKKDKRVLEMGDIDTVASYLGQQSPVYPEEQGRIRFVQKKNGGEKSSFSFVILVTVLFTQVVVNCVFLR